MNMCEIIAKKKSNEHLSGEEIRYVVEGYVAGKIPDYQMSALLMAICFNSMNSKETSELTMAMANSGGMMDLSSVGFCVDKHSTGGVGDKVTLVAGPVAAACGVFVPKMSGRGLGYTGGTIDKLESIKGLRTDLDYDEFINIVKKIGFAITGQTKDLVPADKKIYALRDATATFDSLPLIASSVMSKKIALGAQGIVLDVKVGNGAFMKNIEDAELLANAMIKVGKNAGRKMIALLTDMDKPLGRAVGNSVEVLEAVQTLKGQGPADLTEVALSVATQMMCMADIGNDKKCLKLAEKALSSGKALEVFRKMVELQGGDPAFIDDSSLMPYALQEIEVISEQEGRIVAIECEKVGLTALELGAGRKTKEDIIDHTAGIILLKSIGEKVSKGEPIAILYSSKQNVDMALLAQDFKKVFLIDSRAKEQTVNNVLKIIKGY